MTKITNMASKMALNMFSTMRFENSIEGDSDEIIEQLLGDVFDRTWNLSYTLAPWYKKVWSWFGGSL